MRLDGLAVRTAIELIDELGIGLVVAETGRVLDANRSFCEIVGRSLDEIRGLDDVMLLLPSDERRKDAEVHAAALAGKRLARVRTALLAADGERIPVDAVISLGVRDDGVVEMLVACTDLRDHGRKDLLLERYVALIDRLPVGVFLWDGDGVTDPLDLRLHSGNPAAMRSLRKEPRAAVGQTLGQLFPAADPETAARLLDLRGTDRAEYLGEATYGEEGTDTAALYRSSALALPDGLVAVLFEDITRERAEERHRYDLLRRMVDMGDVERRHLAMAVHDDAIQQLAAATILVEGLRRHPDPPDQGQRLEMISDALHASTASLRRLVFDLSPPELEESGLEAALRSAAEHLFASSDIAVHIDVSLQREPPDVVQTAVFRIAAEALTNVRRHSQATKVNVAVVDNGRAVRAVITDDGIGLQAAAGPGHIGLRSMRERAVALGGGCTVTSGPNGSGTVVSAELPFDGVPAHIELPPQVTDVVMTPGEVESLRHELDSLVVSAAEARRRASASRARLLGAVAMVKAAFGARSNDQEVVTRAARPIAEALPDGCAIWLIPTTGGGLVRVAGWHPDRRVLQELDALTVIDDTPLASHATTVLRSGQPLLLERASNTSLSDAAGMPPEPAMAHSALLAPLIADSVAHGILAVFRDRTADRFADEDVEFATCLASQLALAVAMARGR